MINYTVSPPLLFPQELGIKRVRKIVNLPGSGRPSKFTPSHWLCFRSEHNVNKYVLHRCSSELIFTSFWRPGRTRWEEIGTAMYYLTFPHPLWYEHRRKWNVVWDLFSLGLCSWPPGPAACERSLWASSLTAGEYSQGRSRQRWCRQ